MPSIRLDIRDSLRLVASGAIESLNTNPDKGQIDKMRRFKLNDDEQIDLIL